MENCVKVIGHRRKEGRGERARERRRGRRRGTQLSSAVFSDTCFFAVPFSLFPHPRWLVDIAFRYMCPPYTLHERECSQKVTLTHIPLQNALQCELCAPKIC